MPNEKMVGPYQKKPTHPPDTAIVHNGKEVNSDDYVDVFEQLNEKEIKHVRYGA